MSIKTRKIKLIAVGETSAEKTKVYNYVKKISADLSKVGNEVIRLHVCNQFEIDKLKTSENITKGESIKILEDTLGTSIRNSGYQMLTKYPYISGDIRSSFNSNIYKTISNNFYDILNGKISIPSFRKNNMNIPFQSRKDKDTKITTILKNVNDNIHLKFPQSQTETKNNGEIYFSLFFGRDRSNNRIIVDRVLKGEYQLSDSSIQIKDSEFYLLLVYTQPDSVKESMDANKVMGVDLGINRPISFYIDGEKHQPTQINIGLKIQHERMKFYKQRRSLQSGLKYSKGGHGRTRKNQAIENLREKESNWSTLMNHTISRELIKTAIEYNVGIIKMEDLTGITSKTNDLFLKSWKFAELQQFIVYKAKDENIQIEWIDPKNTSITCSTCKIVNTENRIDKDKTIFKCKNESCPDYDKVKDADVNASRNITYKPGSKVKPKSKEGKILSAIEKKKNLEN